MARNNLVTVTITVSPLEDNDMPIQIDVSEPIKYRTLLTLFQRVEQTCVEAIEAGKDI